MIFSGHRIWLTAGVATFAFAPALAQTPPAPQTSSAANVPTQTAGQPAMDMQDIIVTAQRRAERAQDVPIVITAFSGQRLQQQNITQPQDLQASVPSLVVSPGGQNMRDVQSFTLRGQGTSFQGSPGVVTYLNEVPLLAAVTLAQQGGPGNFVDLENLQVLSGPQGTLFGRNTTGGAVLLVPKKPGNDFSGWVQGKFGNYNDREFEGAINLPIVSDKLLVRAAGAYHDRDGYTHDIVWNKDRDNTHWYSGRIGVTFRPDERIENYLLAYGSYSRNNGTGNINKGFNIPVLAGFGLCSTAVPANTAFSCNVYSAATAQADALGPRRTANDVDSFMKTETWGVEDTLKLELNNGLTLRNIVSYQRFKSFYRYDGDGTVLQQNDLDPYSLPRAGAVTLPGVGSAVAYANASPFKLPRDHYSQITEEVQLQGNLLDRHLTFTAGGFYFHQKPEGFQGGSAITYCPAALTGTPLPATFQPNGTIATGPACIANLTGGYVDTLSKALYAQGTFDFGAVSPVLASLRLTGGFRYTWDTLKGLSRAFTPTGTGAYVCSFNSALVPQATDCDVRATLRSKAPTWTVGLDYKPVRNLMLYAKVSRGYKAGGFNPYAVRTSTLTFEPEFLTSYEAGFKSDFRPGGMPAQFNASYYFIRYSGIQRTAGDFNSTTGASGARFLAADAHIQGVELEASIRPWTPIEIGGTFSYVDFKYTHFTTPNPAFGLSPSSDCRGSVPATQASIDVSCIKANYVAPYVYNFHVALKLPISNKLGEASLFVNYAHSSPTHTEANVLPPGQPGEKLPAFGTLNISLDWNNIGRSGFDAGLFATNATNKLYRVSNSDVYTALLSWSTIYGEPRMYGIKLRYHFGGE